MSGRGGGGTEYHGREGSTTRSGGEVEVLNTSTSNPLPSHACLPPRDSRRRSQTKTPAWLKPFKDAMDKEQNWPTGGGGGGGRIISNEGGREEVGGHVGERGTSEKQGTGEED